MTTGPLLVVQTCLCARGRAIPSEYEITLAPDIERDAPILTFRTRNVALYGLALGVEGRAARVVATYHTDRTGLVLDGLERVA